MKSLNELIDSAENDAECKATDFVAYKNFKGGLGELAGGIGYEAGYRAAFDILAPALKEALVYIDAMRILPEYRGGVDAKERKIRNLLNNRAKK